jgi:nucleoside-diphosphate-sugar epimerase
MSYPWNPYPEEDLEFILSKTSHHFEKLDDSSFLLTGGTGFVGSWMLQFLMYASRSLRIKINLDIVTRKSAPFLNQNYTSLRFIQHDLRTPIDFDDKDYSHVMFASTPSNPMTGGLDGELVSESTVLGTKNLLDMLDRRNSEVKYLNTSSGAVRKSTHPASGQSENINDIYATAKHDVEKLLERSYSNSKISFCSPRLYTFAGPGIALDAHFAIGNFIQDAMGGRDVLIKGSPETVRSYLHPIDMTIQLLECWFDQTVPTFPDIGSFNPIKLSDLAQIVSNKLGNGQVTTLDENQIPSTYIPENPIFPLNYQHITLEGSIDRWVSWLALQN